MRTRFRCRALSTSLLLTVVALGLVADPADSQLMKEPCREEKLPVGGKSCPSGVSNCLEMTMCGLIAFLPSAASSGATVYFVDAAPENKVAMEYPEGADLMDPDLDLVFPRHLVELTLKQGTMTETEANGTVHTCTATPTVFCRRKSRERGAKDFNFYFQAQDASDPKFPNNGIDLAGLVDQSDIVNSCAGIADPNKKYLTLDKDIDFSSPFVEAMLFLDRGTSLFAEGMKCEPAPAKPIFKLARVLPQTICSGASKYAERTVFRWESQVSSEFILVSWATGTVFSFKPDSAGKAIVLTFTNEVSVPNHDHDAPFRWLYRLTTNTSATDHFYLPADKVTECELLGSKCPAVLLGPPSQ